VRQHIEHPAHTSCTVLVPTMESPNRCQLGVCHVVVNELWLSRPHARGLKCDYDGTINACNARVAIAADSPFDCTHPVTLRQKKRLQGTEVCMRIVGQLQYVLEPVLSQPKYCSQSIFEQRRLVTQLVQLLISILLLDLFFCDILILLVMRPVEVFQRQRRHNSSCGKRE
jgi:hypothetical protein